MLPFGLKIVWFILCLTGGLSKSRVELTITLAYVGTISTWVVQMALGTLWGHRKSPWVFLLNLTVYQGMFCLGKLHSLFLGERSS